MLWLYFPGVPSWQVRWDNEESHLSDLGVVDSEEVTCH